jgi:glutamyl-tRNA reductase
MTPRVALLAIDLRNAGSDLRQALTFSDAELDALVLAARSEQPALEIVLVSDTDRLEIYTTESCSKSVFRTVLKALVERVGDRDKLATLRSIEASGLAAGRHLMRLATAMESDSALKILGDLNLAVTRSRARGGFGPELSALFETALEAGWRAFCETSAGDPNRSDAERDIAALEAERLVEEALVSWKKARLSVKKSMPARHLSHYVAADEPGSHVRIKIPRLPGARFA